jgi:hypothetical protein
MPRPLYPRGKSPRYPLDRLGEPQNRSGRREEDSNSDLSVVQPVASRYADYARLNSTYNAKHFWNILYFVWLSVLDCHFLNSNSNFPEIFSLLRREISVNAIIE